jgi:hypothetical protein
MSGCVPVLVGDVVDVGWVLAVWGDVYVKWASCEGAYWITATWGRVHCTCIPLKTLSAAHINNI